jgi:putative flavoprotein involved in K+ transport
MPSHAASGCLDVLVIGGGQAGLAVAWHLRRAGLRFLVLDAGSEIGQAWRDRWDSLRLFSPSQYDGLPGMPFPAAADTYPTRDQVADYLAAYAKRFDLPVLLEAEVSKVERDGDVFVVSGSQGVLRAHQVVLAVGGFRTPYLPKQTAGLAADVVSLHSSQYRNPQQIKGSRVLVVGAGNSGLQIAADLAGTHQVELAVGSLPMRVPQRVLGRDLFWWLTGLGLMNVTADSRIGRRFRSRGDLVIGTRLRDLTRAGVRLRRRCTGAEGRTARFADGDTAEIDAVVWATGYRQDWSWLNVAGAVVDGRLQHDGGTTAVPGLHVIGQPWQRTRGSALLGFVGRAAELVPARVPTRGRERPASPGAPEPRLPVAGRAFPVGGRA